MFFVDAAVVVTGCVSYTDPDNSEWTGCTVSVFAMSELILTDTGIQCDNWSQIIPTSSSVTCEDTMTIFSPAPDPVLYDYLTNSDPVPTIITTATWMNIVATGCVPYIDPNNTPLGIQGCLVSFLPSSLLISANT